MSKVLQNNKATICLGRVELFCLFVACSYTSMEATVLSCRFSWVWSACPKFSEVTNHQFLWKGSCDFVDFLQVVICILLDIHWSYKNVLFWAALSGIASQPFRLSDVLNRKKLEHDMRYQVDYFASVEARKNFMLFWVMTPKYSWPISSQGFLLLTCLTC